MSWRNRKMFYDLPEGIASGLAPIPRYKEVRTQTNTHRRTYAYIIYNKINKKESKYDY